VVLTPLPIAFLPDRGGPMLYILLVGWAMLAALSLRALARRLARDIVFKGIPREAIILVALAGCVAAYVHETWRKDRLA
jgi:type IV secretory pathway TrbD component